MLTKRIIPCLDVKDGQTVKGVNFENLKYAGDPVSLAAKYSQEGADELVFLDITATNDGRGTMLDVVERVARRVFIPFTVGGGIKSVDDFHALLLAGADKVSVNTAAVENPDLIRQAAEKFGSQCVVAAVDAKRFDGDFYVVVHAGKQKTDKKAVDWVKQVESLGAGEILLTSMDADGTRKGFDLELTRLVARSTRAGGRGFGGVDLSLRRIARSRPETRIAKNGRQRQTGVTIWISFLCRKFWATSPIRFR